MTARRALPVDASFVFAAPEVTVTAADAVYNGAPYDSAAPTVTGVVGATPTLTYFDASDTSFTNPLAGAPIVAGSYDVVASLAATAGYPAVTSQPASFTITPAPLTVAADNQFKSFGSADPPLTYHIKAGVLFNGDALSGSLTRAPGEVVGDYPITQGTLTAGTNYSLAFQPATLTISACSDNDFSDLIGQPFCSRPVRHVRGDCGGFHPRRGHSGRFGYVRGWLECAGNGSSHRQRGDILRAD